MVELMTKSATTIVFTHVCTFTATVYRTHYISFTYQRRWCTCVLPILNYNGFSCVILYKVTVAKREDIDRRRIVILYYIKYIIIYYFICICNIFIYIYVNHNYVCLHSSLEQNHVGVNDFVINVVLIFFLHAFFRVINPNHCY